VASAPPQSGPLKVPNAALEIAGWGDLDGWAGDDHASAFATFYASCRPIVRAIAFRAESANSVAARNQFRSYPSKGDARNRLGPHPLTGDARKLGPHQPAGDARKRLAHGQSAGHGRTQLVHPQPTANARPIRAALEEVCARAIKAGLLGSQAALQFFETNFVPVRIRKLGDPAGFLTGYYEPIVDGSRFPSREFTVPVYRRPRDLVAPGVAGGAPFPNTGRAFRQTPTGELVPYYDRAEIEDGALDGQHLEICWLRSAADALSIQIEGSARVRLEDGTMLRISYDAHNGYPFVPVGRVLIEGHLVPREEVSIQRIREWMRDNPDGAKVVRRQNRQVVFFRIVGLNDDTEAIGAQGIPLTAGRSIAVDKTLHAYGTPFFIEADLPLMGPRSQSPFRRLMIAQDTGSAIVGPARADLFFGAGEEAGQVAGRIQQSGGMAMLVPRELGSAIAAASIPLPPVKPGPSLATYAFRPVGPPPAEPQVAVRTLRTGAVRSTAPSAKPEPSRAADHTLRPAGPQAKPALSQVAARALPSGAAPPPARPGQSHLLAPPLPAKTEPSQVANHALLPAALPSAKAGLLPGSARPRQPASLIRYEDGPHTKAPLARLELKELKRTQLVHRALGTAPMRNRGSINR
jgi:membrane-bound lytic murein transglycosylase A